jgi:hypothetical protein
MLGEESGRKALIGKAILGTNHKRPNTGRNATEAQPKRAQVCRLPQSSSSQLTLRRQQWEKRAASCSAIILHESISDTTPPHPTNLDFSPSSKLVPTWAASAHTCQLVGKTSSLRP